MGWFGDAFEVGGKILKWGAPAVLAPFTGGTSLGAYAAYGQSSANKANIALAREQMQFQERMSSTEVQRRMQDYIAAGLNPMLAYNNAASSASGARTEIQSPVTAAVSTALQTRMQQQQLESMHLQNRLTVANTANVQADTNLKYATAEQVAGTVQQIDANIQRISQEFKNLQGQLDLTNEQIRTARLNNQQLEQLQPLLLEYQRLSNQAAKLGMPQREVDAKFAEELGESSKYIRFIQQLFGTPRSTP